MLNESLKYLLPNVIFKTLIIVLSHKIIQIACSFIFKPDSPSQVKLVKMPLVYVNFKCTLIYFYYQLVLKLLP